MNCPPTIAQKLAEFVCNLTLDATPAAAIEEAKRCVLDTVGVIVAGQPSAIVKKTHEHALCAYGRGEASVMNLKAGVHPMAAALINGTAAHANDFDDTSYTGIMHGSAVVLPAALALAEQKRVNGTALLEAFIAGVEVEYAIAELCTDHIYFKGWWTTAVYGNIGSAAACAKMLALNIEQTVNAIALAASMTTGMKVSFGTDGKPLGVGMTACRGMECALLAANGMTGPTNAFEDDRGLLKLLNDNQHNPTCDLQMRQRWRLVEPGILFKSFPVCSAAQAGAELTRVLMQRHQLAADDIDQVICEAPELVTISLVYDTPANVREAQFSMPFAVACIMEFGTLGLDHLSDTTLANPRIKSHMQRVSLQVPEYLLNDPNVPKRCPEGAGITLITTRGQHYRDFLERPTGMPGNPISTDALTSKFLACLAHNCVDENLAQTLAGRLLSLEQITDVRQLLAPLNPVWKYGPESFPND